MFWQWETFNFAPHDGRVYLVRAHEKPVAAAIIVRDGMNYTQLLRWSAAPAADEARVAIEAERNACAALCEEIHARKGERFFGSLVSNGSAKQCAEAIRARGAAPAQPEGGGA